jgi:hypothetical protein
MIDQSTYELEWIQTVSAQLGKRGDPKILEKVIHAFTLLEQLKRTGLDFIFKGGTSLLLLSSPPRRFSIDIDIITACLPEDLTPYLDKVIRMGGFSRWVGDNERKHPTAAPVAHYKFYYTSRVGTRFGEEPILLDVLFQAHPYPRLIPAPIRHPWLQTTGEILSVNIPTIEAIAGDKLTAFAPTTTGILYTKERAVEIIKQLYDIAWLFDGSSDFGLLRESYIRVVTEEIRYRGLSLTWTDTLDDSFRTALLITERDLKNEHFLHLQKGISHIVNFVLERFRIEEATICAAKVAYLTTILRTGGMAAQRYTGPGPLAEWTIDGDRYQRLNRLKRTLPEAFFYWRLALSPL